VAVILALDCSGDALKNTFKPNKQPTRVNFFLDPLAGIPWAWRGKINSVMETFLQLFRLSRKI
jgi:hypothetical protein